MADHPQMSTLLQKAAFLRAGGATWAQVANKVNRKEQTCRSWPKDHPQLWAAAWEKAREEVIDEAWAEAMLVQRELLRDKSDKALRQRSAHSILHHAVASRPTNINLRSIVEQATENVEAAAAAVGLDPEQIEALLENLSERVG